jgi:uncharacterized membrane protein
MTRASVAPRASSTTKPGGWLDPVGGLPRWAMPASLLLGLIGLGLSIYLTIEHYNAPGTLACPATSTVNCARVTTSAQSEVFGVPVVLLGLVFFVALLALCLPPLWRTKDLRIWKARLGVAALGLAFVVYLIFAELFLVNAFCLWCTGVHLVTFLLFGVIALATALADPDH